MLLEISFYNSNLIEQVSEWINMHMMWRGEEEGFLGDYTSLKRKKKKVVMQK